MGLNENNLIKCNKIVRAVGGFVMNCLGWIPMEFRVANSSSKQALYICDKVNRIYFSRPGCVEVGILSRDFPYPVEELNAVGSVNTSVPDYNRPDPQVTRDLPPSKPRKMPFPPIPENVDKLKQYILDSFASSAFNESKPFPVMPGPPAHIHLKEGAVPHVRHVPIPVPFHLRDATKKGLDLDEERGIIKPVPVGTPTDWCSTMVVALKKSGKVRRTVDLQGLNKQCKRETHHTESPFNLACQVPPGTKKTVLDASEGYHAIALDEESQPLTTFITPWGRYMYLRMPQGFVASGDVYTRRYDDIIKDIPRKVKIVDDSLLYDDNIEDAFYRCWDFLTLGSQNGIVYNSDKFQFCQDVVDFAGLKVTEAGVTPSDSMLAAISNFPVPKNITDARSWFGLVNQVAWAYSLGPIMQPFRELVKHNATFVWNDLLDQAFQESKVKIVELVKEGIAAFDVNRVTCLAPDWSKEGMGFFLLQKYCDCLIDKAPVCCPDGWKLIFAGSRYCKPPESRYAPIEGEAAAIVYALERSRLFILGCNNLVVCTDHQPLTGILGDRDLAEVTNPRLLKLKQRTLRFRFSIQHTPGKWHRASDAVSRNPVEEVRAIFEMLRENPSDYELELIEDTEASVSAVITGALSGCQDDIGVMTIDTIREAIVEDDSYTKLAQCVENGFPRTRHKTNPGIREFWNVRDRLSTDNGVVLLDSRIVIPIALRRRVLKCLHMAHQGCTGMESRAQASVYWPGMNASIRQVREVCRTCTIRAPSQSREPLVLSPVPDWPFQNICMDMFDVRGHLYLVVVDRYSGWPIIFHLKPGHATSRHLISLSRSIFVSYGAPDEICSDGGPAFTSNEFKQFLKVWVIKHRVSSVEFAQSNGRAELGVKASKRIIYDNTNSDGSLDNDKVAMAILQYRNTPLSGSGISPAQLLLHRQLRDALPVHPSLYKPHKKWIHAALNRENLVSQRNLKLSEKYNLTAHSLCSLELGDIVAVQNKQKRWTKTGIIVEKLDNRQYRVRMDGSGRITLRNRRFLRKVSPSVRQPTGGIIPSATIPPPATSDKTARRVNFNMPSGSPAVQLQQEMKTPRALKRLEAFNRTPDEQLPTSRLRGGRGDV